MPRLWTTGARANYLLMGGLPVLLLPGGGLNSTIAFFTGNPPFNAIEEFTRMTLSDQRVLPSSESCSHTRVAQHNAGDSHPEGRKQ